MPPRMVSLRLTPRSAMRLQSPHCVHLFQSTSPESYSGLPSSASYLYPKSRSGLPPRTLIPSCRLDFRSIFSFLTISATHLFLQTVSKRPLCFRICSSSIFFFYIYFLMSVFGLGPSCLEVRGEIIITVMCCIVHWSHKHTAARFVISLDVWCLASNGCLAESGLKGNVRL